MATAVLDVKGKLTIVVQVNYHSTKLFFKYLHLYPDKCYSKIQRNYFLQSTVVNVDINSCSMC